MGKKLSNKKVRDFFIDLAFVVAGCTICAFSAIYILVPQGLVAGGITGISRIIQYYFDINFSIVYYLLSMVVLVAAGVFLGMKEVRNIILVVFIYPCIMFVLEHIDFVLFDPDSDLLLANIYAAILEGIGTGLCLYRGYSFGGTDTLSKVIKGKLLQHIDISKILLVINACIILASGFVYGREIAMYALIYVAISAKAIDFVMFGLETKVVKMEIISSEYKQIAEYVMNDLERGATYEDVTGAYTGAPRKVLYVYCTPRESMLVRQYVARLDSKALVTTIHADSVWGDGFKAIDKE